MHILLTDKNKLVGKKISNIFRKPKTGEKQFLHKISPHFLDKTTPNPYSRTEENFSKVSKISGISMACEDPDVVTEEPTQ